MTEPVFVDTNLFLRYITNDVPEQADAVERLLQRAGAGEITLITNSLVICEIVWTLESLSPGEAGDPRAGSGDLEYAGLLGSRWRSGAAGNELACGEEHQLRRRTPCSVVDGPRHTQHLHF